MSFVPDRSRINQEIFRARDEELERNAERTVERDPDGSAGLDRRAGPARVTGWIRRILTGGRQRRGR
jgi:hypothetical protein